MIRRFEYAFLLCLCATLSAVFFMRTIPYAPLQVASFISSQQKIVESKPILFTGDVMLARHVEVHMDEKGRAYPFALIRDFLEKYPYVVGNFEAAIAKVHVATPDMTMRFSVDAFLASILPDVGFTHITLANNHAYDFGKSGLAETKRILSDLGLSVGGHPSTMSIDDVLYIDADGLTVAIVPIHATVAAPDHAVLDDIFVTTASSSDMQIAYIHWGVEYQEKPSPHQVDLAHTLVALGADAVIGHHPHVVQSIEMHHGVPIFYSLGNFIFDQYWNRDVQTGLLISLARIGDTIQFTLFPIESTDSVPSLAVDEVRLRALEDLSVISDSSLTASIKSGVLTIPMSVLASRPQ